MANSFKEILIRGVEEVIVREHLEAPSAFVRRVNGINSSGSEAKKMFCNKNVVPFR